MNIRILDKSLVLDDDDDERDKAARYRPDRSDPNRPSVEQKFEYFWSGPGWKRALAEAQRLESNGVPREQIAEAVGWTDDELAFALKKNKPQLVEEAPKKIIRDRPRRTVKQRVESLKDIDKSLMGMAKRFYEIEVMTVREVCRAIDQPYEKTYLILKKARTKFRRPGRRAGD